MFIYDGRKFSLLSMGQSLKMPLKEGISDSYKKYGIWE